MRYVFKFPDIGEGITEGKILQVYVRKGQAVQAGDPLVKVETDKVVTDIPSPRAGAISSVLAREGEIVHVEDPLVEIEIAGVSGAEAVQIAREKPAPKSETPVAEKGFGVVGTLEVAGSAAQLAPSAEGVAAALPQSPPALRKALATPVARAMARELGIDINQVTGSGPGGRVVKEDILRFRQAGQKAPTPAAAPELKARVEIKDLSQTRKAIARNMLTSKQSTAHMTVFEEVEVSELVRLRESQKERFQQKGSKLTYLPFIVRAVTAALKNHPWLNSQLDQEKEQVIFKHYYNIGVAVDTEEGLLVPVIAQADRLSILELARKIGELAEKARQRTLTLEELRDGTFTVTNYGALGGTYGIPVIYYPQVAILGVGRIMRVPVVRDEQLAAGWILPLSLSVDHRLIDGGMATRFLNEVVAYLKDPLAMLLE